MRDLIGADDLDLAYEVQQVWVRARFSAGARIVGRKIGATSLAVQQQLGVDQEACLGSPLRALSWLARQARDRGGPLRAGQLVRARLRGLGQVSASSERPARLVGRHPCGP